MSRAFDRPRQDAFLQRSPAQNTHLLFTTDGGQARFEWFQVQQTELRLQRLKARISSAV
jgi:hypothetical protein